MSYYMKYKDKHLPDLPSAVLNIACNDLLICTFDERYGVNSSVWHLPKDYGTCEVCAAGAVMAKTFGISSSEFITNSLEHFFSVDTMQKLVAINDFREGDFLNGFKNFSRLNTDRIESAIKELSRYYNDLGLKELSDFYYKEQAKKFATEMMKVCGLMAGMGL